MIYGSGEKLDDMILDVLGWSYQHFVGTSHGQGNVFYCFLIIVYNSGMTMMTMTIMTKTHIPCNSAIGPLEAQLAMCCIRRAGGRSCHRHRQERNTQ